jgi:hypothetical protein
MNKYVLQYFAEREAANQAEYEQCMNEADATLRGTTDANLKRMPIFLATVLGLIVIAWFIELVRCRNREMG